jgi:hypothetical protein
MAADDKSEEPMIAFHSYGYGKFPEIWRYVSIGISTF